LNCFSRYVDKMNEERPNWVQISGPMLANKFPLKHIRSV